MKQSKLSLQKIRHSDGNIANQATEVKMAVHIGFAESCTAVTADGDISNQVTELKMTVHIRFV